MRFLRLLVFATTAACAVAGTVDDDAGFDAAGDGATQKDAAPGDSSSSDAATDAGGGSDGGDASTGSGFASLQVNEIAPNVTGSADLIELLATSGGNIGGITIEQDITTSVVLATLPSVTVKTGDYVVVHLNAPGTVTTETTSMTACTDAACYSGAWDVVGGSTGITYSGRVLLTRGPDAGIQDGTPFYTTSATSPATFHTQVQALQDAGQWLPADCSGNPCSTNALAQAISANWTGAGTTTAKSVARTGNADTNKAADWLVGTSSFGAANP